MSTSTPDNRYNESLAARIEAKWQEKWEKNETFAAPNPAGDLYDGAAPTPESFYLLDMFPYPSGKGLHVGHPLGYIATDVVGRYQRMKGKNVLHTLGYDAFGLPAEQYAVQTGQHPRKTTEDNIANMRTQLRSLGLAHDQRRSFATTDSDYVRWTQWIFLQIFNSWFDPEGINPSGGKGVARPISELIAEFASGKRPVPGPVEWADMRPAEREALLGEYRLAYTSQAPVNWCPGLGTVLANEEVTAEGLSERGNYPVFKRNLRQWMMRITAYCDRLIDDLDSIDWPEKVRSMQRHWIGRSEGATVYFEVPAGQTDGSRDGDDACDGGAQRLEVFTTRPDTLFGATFMAVAPEHPVVRGVDGELNLPAQWPEGTRDAWTGGHPTPVAAVGEYLAASSKKTAEDRADEGREKTGVFTGLYATNPVNGAKVPVFVADYVLWGYGSGAIMAVPAHDERDWEFAKRFNLDIITTIEPPADFEGGAWVGDGALVNSANAELDLNGMNKEESKAAMNAWLEAKGLGYATTTYRLRDWLFSRQRYWGEPFPIVYDEDGVAHALPESMLPLELPEIPDYKPRTFEPQDSESSPEPPLGRAREWVNVTLDLGQGPRRYVRETNTMPNWAGSCWYELRYLDPNNSEKLVDPAVEKYWMGPREGKPLGGADLYVGGVEHAVLHLLYARFWHKVLYDLGHVSSVEPFHRLFNQGYIQAYAYTDSRGQYVPADEVEEVAAADGSGEVTYRWQGEAVNREYGKMGKSLKNIVTPDYMCATYGADTFRLYEMAMGPLDLSRPWETRAVVGSQRFLQRLWRNVVDEDTGACAVAEAEMDLKTARLVASTINDVEVEMSNMRMNTAIAKMIVLNNHLTGLSEVPRAAVEPLVLMLAPIAPHIAEELWERLGHSGSLAYEPFPAADPALLVEETVTCVVQVAGKVRDRLEVPVNIDPVELEKLALATNGVARHLGGKPPLKVIVRAPRLVSVVPSK